MYPQIDFKHVLSELSVNRNDPCEVIRELISNSYDAGANKIKYAGIESKKRFIFWDNGSGLEQKNNDGKISPYEAFFSIGKSTKTKGTVIGYKCQGSKLCFASNRVLIISRTINEESWFFHITENPRQTLTTEANITPTKTGHPWKNLAQFIDNTSHEAGKVLAEFGEDFFKNDFKTGTLIAVQELDVENFTKHLLGTHPINDCYLANFIRFSTCHGDTRRITKQQGFKDNQVKQVNTLIDDKCRLEIFDGEKFQEIPFGFPYLSIQTEIDIKSPQEIARLRDGRFSTRHAKRFKHGNNSYCLILAVDGNRRAHENYTTLDRKGAAKSGLRLSDQRGVSISVNGIKICKQNEIFFRPELEEYQVLSDSDSLPHYLLIIDGPFDLVTNRNSISKSAAGAFEDSAFISEIKKFLDDAKKIPVFNELIGRLNREQRETKLNQQIQILDQSKTSISTRERFRISNSDEIYVSPLPGEEYLVGVLYACLNTKVPKYNNYLKYWIKVFTFSTQGIDSIGSRENSLAKKDLIAIEYKYEFTNYGPFNHALSLVNIIVSWDLKINEGDQIQDDYDCFGKIKKIEDGIFTIYDIEDKNGGVYEKHEVTVVSLKSLIKKTWPTATFTTPPKK